MSEVVIRRFFLCCVDDGLGSATTADLLPALTTCQPELVTGELILLAAAFFGGGPALEESMDVGRCRIVSAIGG